MHKKFGFIVASFLLSLVVSCGNVNISSTSQNISSSSNTISSSTSSKPEYAKNSIFFDSNSLNGDGTIDSPYNTLDSISNIDFVPGTHLYFKSGSLFTGSLKLVNVHGSKEEPIVITSYTKGSKPKFDGNNLSNGAVLHLFNCSNIIVENLEFFDSNKEEGDKRGVLIECNNNIGTEEIITYENITLTNLYVHDINGYRDASNSGMSMESKRTGGMHVWSSDGFGRVKNLDINNCKIYNVSNVGIATWYKMVDAVVSKVSPYSEDFINYAHLDVKIRNNDISFIGKNAIFARHLYGGVIEYNVIHDTAIYCVSGNTIVTSYVDGTIIQYNEGYRNMASERASDGKLQDGCMLDADLQSKYTVWQYNYSHDNAFGLFLNCTSYDASKNILDKAIVRYNISINDLGKKGIVYINYESDGIEVYNNTFITGRDTEYIFQQNNKRKCSFYNNLIYNRSSKAKFLLEDDSYINCGYNLIYNDQDANVDNLNEFKAINLNGVYDDPIFQGFLQEDSNYGINDLFTYQLEHNSPALGIGKQFDGVKEDFFGNEYKPSIGFYCG